MSYDLKAHRDQQETAIKAALVLSRDELVKRVIELDKLNSLTRAHRALVYLTSTEYDRLRDSLDHVPEIFRPAKAAFDTELGKQEETAKQLFQEKNDLRASAQKPLTIDVLVNQHKNGTQLYLPLKFEDLDTPLLRSLYDHCKRELERYQPNMNTVDGKFADYQILACDRAVNKDSVKERIENVPEGLKEANIAIRVVAEFCFPYTSIIPPKTPAAQTKAPSRTEQPARTAFDRPCQHYGLELKQYIYDLRDKNVLAGEIAAKVKERFNVEMSKGTVMAVLAWRNRPVKKA